MTVIIPWDFVYHKDLNGFKGSSFVSIWHQLAGAWTSPHKLRVAGFIPKGIQEEVWFDSVFVDFVKQIIGYLLGSKAQWDNFLGYTTDGWSNSSIMVPMVDVLLPRFIPGG